MADEPNTADGRSLLARRAVPILGAMTVASLFVACYFAGQTHALRQEKQAEAENYNPLGLTLPTLDASSAVTSEKFSMATGLMSDRTEALFVLDHNSGLLQCSVMYPRMRQFLGLFVVNVHDALGTGKGAQYMMTTGMVDMPQSNANPVALSFVYVLNTTTGSFACYGIPFNRTFLNSNKPQQGAMVLLATGNADPVIDRDGGR
jgi:hypothetical protein